MKDDPLKGQSRDFAIKIIFMARKIQTDKHEYDLSRQVLKSGTSIGANLAEARFAASKADFINKMRIALKEANETSYWLDLLHATDLIDNTTFEELSNDCKSIIYLLIKSINTSRIEN